MQGLFQERCNWAQPFTMTDYNLIDATIKNDLNQNTLSHTDLNQTNVIYTIKDGLPAGDEDSPPGLSKAHSCTLLEKNAGKLTVWENASLIKAEKYKAYSKTGGGKRGTVKGFTADARRRLMYELNTIKSEILPVYSVLTFPDEYYPNNTNGLAMRNLIKAFRMRILRKYPQSGSIYRREFEDRKSGLYVGEVFPHINILTWGVDQLEFRDWVKVNWWEVCGKLSQDHLQAGTYTKLIESRRQMFYYMSKYIAKVDARGLPNFGNWWGYINKAGIPFDSPIEIELNDHQARKMVRYVKRKGKIKRNIQSCTVMTENPVFWSLRVAEILV